ncbi:MAG: RusA family crossover junction endodeoxyribonuclease [Maricaulis sp.]|jgi:crossover junction endodeoxyribonuclease RusA|nr:RusA family crossover junction endodeoxyribonuclease [Maricaulis sp.]MDG2045253.1 RusA family crossover junction endodeoxyribonuclease [Maricaulis sp.]
MKQERQNAMSGDALSLRIDSATTQTRRFKTLVGEFLRLEFARVKPKFGPYEMQVDIVRARRGSRSDADKVARAVLDALSSVVFSADSRVEKLTVNRVVGRKAQVTVTAKPIGRIRREPEVRAAAAKMRAAS